MGPSVGFLEKPFGQHPLGGPLGSLFSAFWARLDPVFVLRVYSGTSAGTQSAHLDFPEAAWSNLVHFAAVAGNRGEAALAVRP